MTLIINYAVETKSNYSDHPRRPNPTSLLFLYLLYDSTMFQNQRQLCWDILEDDISESRDKNL